MHEVNSLSYRFIAAMIIALLCHLMALLALKHFNWLPAPEPRPVLEVSLTRPAPSRATEQLSSPPLPEPQPSVISTEAETPPPFQVPTELPERRQSFRSPSADTTWVDNLFTAKDTRTDIATENLEQPSPEEETRVLADTPPVRSSYHQQLIQILARHRYHDAQYSFTRLTRHHRVVLNLVLHPSGALLRADIRQTSGDSELDAAAQRSAYAASPFPPPPPSDADFKYNYPIEIQYQPR